MQEANAMTIGQLARAAEIGVETIRFYEREGLLDEPPRRPSGYRQYPQSALDRLTFIRRAKDLGFTLREIAEFVAIAHNPVGSCDTVRSRAEVRLADVEERIQVLEEMRARLKQLVASCSAAAPNESCAFLPDDNAPPTDT